MEYEKFTYSHLNRKINVYFQCIWNLACFSYKCEKYNMLEVDVQDL